MRAVIRELHHALVDLNHEAFPGYASTWQDDITHAREHIVRAHEEIDKLIASWGVKQDRRGSVKGNGTHDDRRRRDDR